MTFLIRIFIILSILFSPALFADELIIEPDAGREPIISAIDHAKSSIDLVMYGFTDARFLNSLVQAKKAGKNVQVLLEPNPYRAANENEFAIKRLQNANISLQWPSHDFKLTHQKTFLLDGQRAIVMTFNLTNSTFKNERNFALVIDDPDMVKEIDQVFTADWQHKKTTVKNPNLIWSPNNSRDKILNFIHDAQSEIKIYAQDLSDYQTIGALAQVARMGKRVEIILSQQNEKKMGKLNYLRKAGVKIHVSRNYVIHAKIIIADRKRAILGSINLTKASMNDNRELAVITQDPKVVGGLLKTFEGDWQDANSLPRSLNPKVSHMLLREIKRLSRELAQLA